MKKQLLLVTALVASSSVFATDEKGNCVTKAWSSSTGFVNTHKTGSTGTVLALAGVAGLAHGFFAKKAAKAQALEFALQDEVEEEGRLTEPKMSTAERNANVEVAVSAATTAVGLLLIGYDVWTSRKPAAVKSAQPSVQS